MNTANLLHAQHSGSFAFSSLVNPFALSFINLILPMNMKPKGVKSLFCGYSAH